MDEERLEKQTMWKQQRKVHKVLQESKPLYVKLEEQFTNQLKEE